MVVVPVPAYALTLTCEIGVTLGTKVGPQRYYTLTLNEGEDFVTGSSGGVTRRVAIIDRSTTAGVESLVLDNGEPTVRTTLVLGPEPRMQVEFSSGLSQTDLCEEN